MSDSDDEKESTVEQVVERLAGRFPEADRGRIAGIVSEEYDALDSGRIRTFIPTLVEKGAKTRLRREFAAEGSGAGA
ncbi:three-helix bundle dimerization domain-containing protein [Arthrobacter sp. NPDC057013]|uniref:three-helix bundle dimerization domain-containing protein n=1 Tax=Arthrobacter sp. NPDC057013 TaxID=3345999 RepID=UPI0036361FD5